MFALRTVSTVISALVIAGAAGTQNAALKAIDRTNFDTTCSPCQDFFRYANGGWDSRTSIPPQYTVYGVSREVQDRNEAILRKVIEDAARDSSTANPTTPISGGSSARPWW